MELVVLGSGCFAPPRPGRGEVRNPSGYAVRLGDETVLLDFGFGNLRQLARAGISPESVSTVFITHLHLDHVGDLPALLFHFRYGGRPPGGVLSLAGPPGFKAWFRRLQAALKPNLDPRGYRLKVVELAPGKARRGARWKVTALAVPHFVRCQAYALEAKGKRLVYSGDTGYHEPLARFAAGADLFILECSQPASEPLPEGHLTARDALKLLELAGARRALLSHVSEGSAREARALLARRNGMKAAVARDLLRVRL